MFSVQYLKMFESQHLQNYAVVKSCTNTILLIDQDVVYPRKCEICCNIFISKEAFTSHKKMCTNSQILHTNVHQIASYPRQCGKCLKIYTSSSSFSHHKRRCSEFQAAAHHPISYPRKCDKCLRIYRSKSTFSQHKQKCSESQAGMHDTGPSLAASTSSEGELNAGTHRHKTYYPRQCDQCLRTYNSRSAFGMHKKTCSDGKVQSKEVAVGKVFNCLSPGCEDAFVSPMSLSLHLKYMHGVDDLKKLSFDNMAQFERWLEVESTKTFSSYKKITGCKKTGSKLHHYYRCHFSNPPWFTPKSGRRNTKGTIPRDINCPSRMYICQEEGRPVSVSYYYMHNHSLVFENCKLQQLKKSARDLIKANLRLHVPIKKIQELLKEEAAARVNGESFPIKEAFVTCKQITSYRRYICNGAEDDASSGEYNDMEDYSRDNENCQVEVCEPHSVEVTFEDCRKLTAELLELIRTCEVQNHGLGGVYSMLKTFVAQCKGVIMAENNSKVYANEDVMVEQ